MHMSWATEMAFSGGALFFGSPLLAAVIGGAQNRSGDSLVRPSPDGRMTFRTPFVERAPQALIGLTFFGGALFWIGVGFDPRGPGGAAVVLMVAPCLAMAAWCLRRAGPEEVRLDLAAHTYRRVTGWPLFPKVLSGRLSHLPGVYVERVDSTRSSPYYLVGLSWSASEGRSVVARYDRRETAEAQADIIRSALDAQRASPSLGQTQN